MEWKDTTTYTIKERLIGQKNPRNTVCKLYNIEVHVFNKHWKENNDWDLNVIQEKDGNVIINSYPLKSKNLKDAQAEALEIVRRVYEWKKGEMQKVLDDLEYFVGGDKCDKDNMD